MELAIIIQNLCLLIILIVILFEELSIDARIRSMEKTLSKIAFSPAVKGKLFLILNGVKKEVKMAVLKDNQKLTLFAEFDDAKGAVAALPAVPSWGLTDSSLGSLSPSVDGLSCVLVAGSVGQGKVQCTGTNEDGQVIVLELDVRVVPSEAVSGKLSAADPVNA